MPAQPVQQICLVLITVLLTLAALMYGETIFAPLFLALVVGIILSPISDVADRIGIPRAVSAFATMAFGLMLLMSLFYFLEPWVRAALDKAPVLWRELEGTMAKLRSMMQGIEDITANVSEAIEPGSEAAAEDGEDGDETQMSLPKVTDAVLYAPGYLAQFMTFIGSLYFFLLGRMDIYEVAGKTVPGIETKDLIRAEHRVARYFLTITIINACFGVIVATVMSLLGLPSPMFWGVLAFLVNYILYLGPALLAVGLLLTGITVFDGFMSVAPAFIYLVLNATEGQFVTPTFVGKSMSVNALLVFLSLVFWLWIWGPIGGFIAIPLLVWSLSLLKPAAQEDAETGVAKAA